MEEILLLQGWKIFSNEATIVKSESFYSECIFFYIYIYKKKRKRVNLKCRP